MTSPLSHVSHRLLSREQFKHEVFARAGGRCVFCSAPAVDAHHILDRKLWPDGGYYLDNGAAVCERHHMECETTALSVEQVRHAARVVGILLPPGFPAGQCYDKWGNVVMEGGFRQPGPLFQDDGCQKVLRRAGYLWLFAAAADDGAPKSS